MCVPLPTPAPRVGHLRGRVIPWRSSSEAGRGGAVAATWIFRGHDGRIGSSHEGRRFSARPRTNTIHPSTCVGTNPSAGRLEGARSRRHRGRDVDRPWGTRCETRPRNIRVAAAASPRPVLTEYPRRGRGVAAARLPASRPRRRRDSSPRKLHGRRGVDASPRRRATPRRRRDPTASPRPRSARRATDFTGPLLSEPTVSNWPPRPISESLPSWRARWPRPLRLFLWPPPTSLALVSMPLVSVSMVFGSSLSRDDARAFTA